MTLKTTLLFTGILVGQICLAQFAPPANQPGTTAIHKDSVIIVNWATEVVDFQRGLEDITNPDGLYAAYGDSTQALGPAEGNSADVVSLGDHGSITLAFDHAVRNGAGFDFAVFENGFSHDYLELAHVEVSTDGVRFVRFPSISNIQNDSQTGTFGTSDAKLINNLAGKYIQAYGTPFDLNDLIDSADIDVNEINFIRIIDVIGTIDPDYGTRDSEGNLINEPFKTDFESGGFDLDAVGVINDKSHSLNIAVNEPIKQNIYPNPTTGFFTIDLDQAVDEIRIMDYLGRTVYTGNDTQIDFNQLGVEAGTYFVMLTDLAGSATIQKIVFRP